MINTVVTAGLLTVTWVIWNGTLDGQTIIKGVVLAFAVLQITNRFLLRGSYARRYSIGVVPVLRFLGILIVEIFRSGVHAIYVTVTNRLNVGIVDIPAGISDPLRGVLVASAITLTPGTVTIDYDTTRYKVIWIDCPTTDAAEAGQLIKGSFEKVLQ